MNRHRPISFLKSKGDMEWLATKPCPKCGTLSLHFGCAGRPREVLTCMECGHVFRIKGRLKKKYRKACG